MKRIIALFLILVMCISMLAACDTKENKETTIDRSTIKGEEIKLAENHSKLSFYIDLKETTSYQQVKYRFTEEEANQLCNILNNSTWMKGDLSENVREKCKYEFVFSNSRGYYYREGVFYDKKTENVTVLSKKYTKTFNEIIDSAASREPEKSDLFAKPVIYLYPEADTVCSVNVNIDGELTCTYPNYGVDGWQNFTANPDGTLTFPDGREYYCLYWEGVSPSFEKNFEKGFCVKGSDSAEFLNSALLQLGLTPREANEFIIYWLPKLEANEYNLLSFQFDNYTNSAPLEITPAPDSVLRVFLAMKPLDEFVEIEPQELPAFERNGFTVVEWGGTWVE